VHQQQTGSYSDKLYKCESSVKETFLIYFARLAGDWKKRLVTILLFYPRHIRNASVVHVTCTCTVWPHEHDNKSVPACLVIPSPSLSLMWNKNQLTILLNISSAETGETSEARDWGNICVSGTNRRNMKIIMIKGRHLSFFCQLYISNIWIFHSENMGIAVKMSLLSCRQTNIHVCSHLAYFRLIMAVYRWFPTFLSINLYL